MFERLSATKALRERLADVEEGLQAAARRLEGLEGDLDYLRLEFRRLRGTVTGNRRKAESAEPEDGSGAPTVLSLDEKIRRGMV